MMALICGNPHSPANHQHQNLNPVFGRLLPIWTILILEIGAKTMAVVVETTMMKEPLVILHQIKMAPSDQEILSLLRIPIILGVITNHLMDPTTIQLDINVVMSTIMTGIEVIIQILVCCISFFFTSLYRKKNNTIYTVGQNLSQFIFFDFFRYQLYYYKSFNFVFKDHLGIVLREVMIL